MKHICTLIYFFCILSCGKNDDNDPKHYNFNSNDYLYIPTGYKDIGKVFTFKNDLNEKIELKVVSYDMSIEKGGGVGESKPVHTYDQLIIKLKVIENNSDCDSKTIKITKWGGSLITRISSKASSIPCADILTFEKFEYPYPFNSMSFDDQSYDKVVTIFKDSKPYFSPNYEFNNTHFDFKNGFIGFDDDNMNVKFRLIKE